MTGKPSSTEYSDISKPTTMDYVHSILKAGFSAVPGIGSALGEFLDFVIVPEVELRRTHFLNDLANRLKQLEEEGRLSFQDLKDNPQFIDTVLSAVSMAQRTSEEEKLVAFRNAILNTALHISPEKAITEVYIRALNNFTAWHLRVLDLIADPAAWFKRHNIEFAPSASVSILTMIAKAYPLLNSNRHLLHVIWNDLENESFHRQTSYENNLPPGSTLASLTTAIGNSFLEFIREPKIQ